MRFILLLGLFLSLGCAKKVESLALDAKIEPPVSANIPSGFLSNLSMQSDSTLSTIRTRFFNSGPTEIRALLSSVDQRMTELARRELESHRTCLDQTPILFSLTSPFDLRMDHYLSCEDQISSTQWLGLGQKDGTWYLREGQTKGFLTLAKIDSDSNVEAWIAVSDSSQVYTSSQMLMHLKSTKANHQLELSVTGSNLGVGCGVQLKANQDQIYVSGRMDDPSGGAGVDCSSVIPSEICVNSATLDMVSTSLCSEAGLSTFDLQAIDYVSHPYDQINLLGTKTLSGLRDF